MTSRFNSLDEYVRELADAVLQRQWEYAPYAAADFRRRLPAPFDSLASAHLRVLYLLSRAQYPEAYKQQVQLAQCFIKDVLKNERQPGNWYLPICFRICGDLRLIARVVDRTVVDKDAVVGSSLASAADDDQPAEITSMYEKSATVIMECYRACVSDTRSSYETSKRLGLLNLTNQLFRVYFRINKLNLLKPLIRAIDNCGDLYDYFCMADKVTYSYYIGRKAMVDSRLDFAESSLDFAYVNTPEESHRNRRLILMYLIPVKMQLGHMPQQQLLQHYNLDQFLEVLPAVKSGNVKQLERVLEKHRLFFIQAGIFLMMENLMTITYRTLFKKVCKILGGNQISLSAFLQALRYLEIEDVDQDEVACIVANLIFEGKVKGYLSHQHQKLVISKVEPFPNLATVASA